MFVVDGSQPKKPSSTQSKRRSSGVHRSESSRPHGSRTHSSRPDSVGTSNKPKASRPESSRAADSLRSDNTRTESMHSTRPDSVRSSTVYGAPQAYTSPKPSRSATPHSTGSRGSGGFKVNRRDSRSAGSKSATLTPGSASPADNLSRKSSPRSSPRNSPLPRDG